MKRVIGLLTAVLLVALSQPVWLTAQMPVTVQADRVRFCPYCEPESACYAVIRQ